MMIMMNNNNILYYYIIIIIIYLLALLEKTRNSSCRMAENSPIPPQQVHVKLGGGETLFTIFR